MHSYVGNITLTISPPSPSRGAVFVAKVPKKRRGAQDGSLDLLPLILVLRASPRIHFTLDAECAWLCSREALGSFMDDARSSRAWVVTPVLEALTLRVREAQERYWIVDMTLRKDLWWVYETVGFLAWVEVRGERGREGVTVCVEWDREEAEVVGRKRRWASKLRSGLGRVWSIVRGLRVKVQERVWYGSGIWA